MGNIYEKPEIIVIEVEDDIMGLIAVSSGTGGSVDWGDIWG